MMVAQSALRHLDTRGDRKEKLEVFFDLSSVLDMFSSKIDILSASQEDSFAARIQDEVDKVLQEFFPSSEELVQYLKDQYSLNITNDFGCRLVIGYSIRFMTFINIESLASRF